MRRIKSSCGPPAAAPLWSHRAVGRSTHTAVEKWNLAAMRRSKIWDWQRAQAQQVVSRAEEGSPYEAPLIWKAEE
ncbi:uncharacterized protein N7503_009369 [Penicillium pulvis]|uniref:uncharacterized protein n=1 Tax=Penicillium pulvis TaxID=1562058 RepID=UPI00254730DA|nr:uncharacterized protein N7503_009369 [Penicillium pulvis]KAJ5793391.1 hypothetical protein N7503_009369 [Penicillium pulvis]